MNHHTTFWKILLVVFFAPLPLGLWAFGQWLLDRGPPTADVNRVNAAAVDWPLRIERAAGMVRIEGGEFLMGGRGHVPADQTPVHRVRLDPFWLDQHLVTNRQFAAFVAATGYQTTAERRGASLVFDGQRGEWQERSGANWRNPEGPRSTLLARDEHPVVHVSWHDAAAYAARAGKRLVTEAEYERAARGGVLDARYAWGDEQPSRARPLANYWQGRFPARDLGLDGFRGLAPVGQFPPNRYGLYDMAGNVWCWCQDGYDADYYAASPSDNPRGPQVARKRVLRGGSWLSTCGQRDELAVAARGHAPPDHTTNHIGFRCASSTRPLVRDAEVARRGGDNSSR